MRSEPYSAADRLLPGSATALPLGLAVVALVLIPLVDLIRTTITTTGGSVLDALDGEAIANSLWTAAVAATLATAIGVATARIMTRRGSRAWHVMVLLPLLVPPFVSALAWSRAFGRGGLMDDLVGWTLPGLIGPVGIVVVLAVHAAPLVYLVVGSALRTRARPELEWAARASGADAGQALRRVTLPLLAPAIAGGGLLAFVVSLNSFGIPAVLGVPAGFPTITTRIFGDLARSADPAAFHRVLLLSTVLMALVLVAVAVATATMRRVAGGASSASREPLPVVGGGRPPILMSGYLVATTVLPLAALVLTGLTRAAGLDPWPANWTLANFAEAWQGDAWGAVVRTVVLAATAATVATVLGLLLALARRGGTGIGLAVAAAFAVPGSALAVAVLLAYGPWLRDTVVIILIAYLAKFWALAHRAIAGSCGVVDRDSIRAARASGATGAVTLRRVVLPMLRPALAAAWVLVFLFGLHELTMSSLLYGPGTATLAVVTLEVQQLGDVTVTAALAVLLTVPGIGAAVMMGRQRGTT
ncbi:MAG: iron ABC transporter permease [Acidimicrobiia bacterium]|nr:iron ABC transporter permease [Acidimicrobiia bacterium]